MALPPGILCGLEEHLGHRDLFYVDDKDVDFKDVIEAHLPKHPWIDP